MTKKIPTSHFPEASAATARKPRASVSAELNLLEVFEHLVSRLPRDPAGEVGVAAAAPLIEIEREGQIYTLYCRKKTIAASVVELSPREKEIARMISEGFPNKAIAGVLDISEWTVGTHLRRVFAKLGVSCRAAMVAKWFELQPANTRRNPSVNA